jgi:hypothetical protein
MSEESHNSDVPHHPERRRYPRSRTRVQIELHAPGVSAPFRTATEEISHGGCYVETMFTFPAGTKLTMTLWLDSEQVSATGIVATCYPQVGNGIEFVDMSAEDVKKLEQFLAVHAGVEEHG